jgi:predicted TIM-barrel fold metal-dependent hydrolase
MMETVNISKSILSISSPGTSLYPQSPDKSAELTRKCNSFAASLKQQHPSKFGFWASLPLPFIPESLKEIETALAEGADGFALLTNYQGHYLGDPTFEAIFALLDEKKARIFIHPTMPCTHHHHQHLPSPAMLPATPLSAVYPVPMFEFFFDTARAACNLLLRGTVVRRPALTFILPHAAGAFPPLLSRLAVFSTLVPDAFPAAESGSESGGVVGLAEDEMRELLDTRFFFDLAGAVFPGQLEGMLVALGVGTSRLLYGSDFPFTSAMGVEMLAVRMEEGLEDLVGGDGLESILKTNAVSLLSSGTQAFALKKEGIHS